jgi:hypothetical protein
MSTWLFSTDIIPSNFANWSGNMFSAAMAFRSFQLSHTSSFKLKPEAAYMALP